MLFSQIDWHQVLTELAAIVGFLGDVVTCIVGFVTIYGLIKYRKRLSAAFRLFRLHHLNDRRDEIKQTLELIRAVDIPKGRATEARALFGRLNGQMLPLCDVFPEFKGLQATINQIAHLNGKLTEPIKQQLIHQITSEFESFRLRSMDEAVGERR